MIGFWKKDKDANVLLEINFNRIHDYEKLEKSLKNIKGIISIDKTSKKSESMPDIIGFAHWDNKEITERMKELNKIPYISKINHRILIKA